MNFKTKETKTPRTRFNLFQVVIHHYDQQIQDYRNLSDTQLVQSMENSLINQIELEHLLLDARFAARKESKKYSEFTDFGGQLEKGVITNQPHWQLFVKSRITTSPAIIRRFFSNALFHLTEHSAIRVTIAANEAETKAYVDKEGEGGYWSIPNTPWFPGKVQKKIAEARRLLEENPTLQLLDQGGAHRLSLIRRIQIRRQDKISDTQSRRPSESKSASSSPPLSETESFSEISEDEKIAILETGFQLHKQGKISLKKY